MTKSTVSGVCYSVAAGCVVSAVASLLVASRMGELHSMDDVLLVGGVQGLAVLGGALFLFGLLMDFSDNKGD